MTRTPDAAERFFPTLTAGDAASRLLLASAQTLEIPADQPIETLVPSGVPRRPTHQVSVFLEVEGAAHYLPAYAGNLDIMTSAAMRVAERIAARELAGEVAR